MSDSSSAVLIRAAVSAALSVIALGTLALPLSAQVRVSDRVTSQAPAGASSFWLPTRRPALGISVSGAPGPMDTLGVVIRAVTPGSPAARAGLRAGDVLTRFDGSPLSSRVRVRTPLLQGNEPPGFRLIVLASEQGLGDTATVEFVRGPERHVVRIAPDPLAAELVLRQQLSTRPDIEVTAVPLELPTRTWTFNSPGSGRFRVTVGSLVGDLHLSPLNAELGRYFGTSEGVLVLSVPGDTPLRLQGGDVIRLVDGRPSENPLHLMRILQSYRPGENFRFEIMRDKKPMTVSGTMPER